MLDNFDVLIKSFEKLQERSKFTKEKQQRMLHDWLLLERTNKLNTVDICKLFIDGEVDPVILKVWEDIYSDLDAGMEPVSIHKWFPDEIAAMLLSAFSKGKKAEVINLCLDTYTKSSNLFVSILIKTKISLLYASLLILSCFFYNEKFSGRMETFPIDKWEDISVLGYKTTEFVINYYLVVIFVIVGLYAWINYLLPNKTGIARANYAMKYPIFKEYRYDSVGNMLKTLSILRQANTRLIDAIEILKSTATPYMNELLNLIADRADRGDGLSAALCIDGLLDPQDKLIIQELLKRAPGEDIQLFDSISERYYLKKERGIKKISYGLNFFAWVVMGYLLITVPIGEMMIGFAELSHRM